MRWNEVEFTVVYRAVYVRYLHSGVPDREAKNRALAEVKGYLGKGNPSSVRLLSAPNGQTGQETDGQSIKVKDRVRAYLDANPELAHQTVREVVSALRTAGVGAGRTTVSEVLQERKLDQ